MGTHFLVELFPQVESEKLKHIKFDNWFDAAVDVAAAVE
jgi:hypothetical protein